MPNTVQLKKNGQPVFPVTDVSLVMGLAERPLMDAVYAWDGTGTPDITKIPAGVTVEYNSTTYTGTLAASADTTARFYLVPSTTVQGEYDRYLTDAVSGSYSWKSAGTTAIPTPSIVDNLESTDPTKALSAKQGKVLNEELGELEAKVDEFNEDLGIDAELVQNGGLHECWIYFPVTVPSGGKLKVALTGTAVFSVLQLRLNDSTSSFVQLSNNTTQVVTPNVDTTKLHFIIANSNITTPGTCYINVSVVSSLREDLDALEERVNKGPVVIDRFIVGENHIQGKYRGYFSSSTPGLLVDSTTYKVTGFIDVRGVKSYTRSVAIESAQADIVFDKDFNIIRTIKMADGVSITLSEDAAFMKFSVKNTEVILTVTDIYENFHSIGYKKIVQEANVSVIGPSDFDRLGMITWSNTIKIRSNETYYYTRFIPVSPAATYSYNGTLDDSATIRLYDLDYRVYKTFDRTSLDISSITPSKLGYISISSANKNVTLKPNVGVSLALPIPTDNELRDFMDKDFKVNNSGKLEKVLGGVYDTFRLSMDFTIGGYAETSGNYPIAQIGDLSIEMVGAANGTLSYTDEGTPSTYPLPKRNVSFVTKNGAGTSLGSWTNTGLPVYKEIIGEDVFGIRYVSSNISAGVDSETVQTEYGALSNVLALSFLNGVVHIWNKSTNTDIVNVDVSAFTVKDFADYIGANYPNFIIEIYGNSYTQMSDLADITEVVMVSTFKKTHVGSLDTRYEAYFCYFQKKVDESIHNLEVVSINGQTYAVIDGEPILNTHYFAGMFKSILLGNADTDCPITPVSVELNINHIGDAEPQDYWRIVSKYNPSIVPIMGHPIYFGDECDGLTPIYEDETPGAGEAAVVPVKYRSIPGAGSMNIGTSTNRLVRLLTLAKEKGYQFVRMHELADINRGTLPKRCFAWAFDDERQYFFFDLDIRAAFATGGNIVPTLAIQFWPSETIDPDYLATQAKLDRAGWESVMHGLDAVNVCTMSAAELYDKTSANSSDMKMFHRQVETAERILDWTVWVYSNGSANPNTIKAFEHNGVRCGIMTEDTRDGIHGRYGRGGQMPSRAMNKYFILRTSIAEKYDFDSLIAPLFV